MPVVLPKRPRSFLARTPVASAVLLALASPPLMAQDTTTLGEVIVTAQKRERTCRTCRSASRRSAASSWTSSTSRTSRTTSQFLPTRARCQHRRRRLRLQRGLHARRRDRRRRPGHDLAAERRHVPRRAADHDHPGQPRHPHVRHRARRGARRPAGHAVRRELAGGHDPHHHQQARPVRFRGRLRARRQLRRHGRASATSRRASSTCRSATTPPPPGRLGQARRGLDRQRARRRASIRRPVDTADDIAVDNAEFAEDNYNTSTRSARARRCDQPRRELDGHAQLMYQKQEQEGSWGDDLNDVHPEDSSGRPDGRALPRRVRRTTSGTRRGSRSKARSATSTSCIPATTWTASRTVVRLLRLFVLVRHRCIRRVFPDCSSTTTATCATGPRVHERRLLQARRATSCASARRRTSACAACSASSTRSRSTTFTRSSAGSRASPTPLPMDVRTRTPDGSRASCT